MVNENPAISVIMGVYNNSRTLERAIQSILNQSFDNIEFIICDDCSSDDSYNKLLKLKETDKRIIIIKNKHNMGLSHSLNKCIEMSHGKYLARMDGDDISHTDRLKKQFDFIEANPEISIVGCRRNTFDEDGIWQTSKIYGELSSADIISGNIFTHPTVMMRKCDVECVGGYTESKRTLRGQDFDLWCKMYSHGYKGYILDSVLFDYFEDRNTLKEPKFKTRYYNFITHLLWRKKMDLPIKYDIYAWKEIFAGILPSKLLIFYKKIKSTK